MTLTYFSPFYFIYPVLCLGAFIGLYFGLRNKSRKVQYWVLWGITMFNFALHFLKLCFHPYVEDLPASIRKVTFENICAVSTLVFPFFFLSKKPMCLDYMFYLGTISGIASMFAPMNIIGLNVYDFETIRFYVCHGSLWIVPLLSVIFGIHKLDYHRLWKLPFMYYLCLLVILINEAILTIVGWAGDGTLDYFLSTEVRNSAYIFGPPESMEKAAQFILVLTPSAFKPGGIFENYYTPIMWEVIPVYIYCIVLLPLMSLYWEHEHMREDLYRIQDKLLKIVRRIKIKNFVKSKFRLPKRRHRYIKRCKAKPSVQSGGLCECRA